ncbi:unnamed protein product [Leptidea sinapis]|uniref:Phorbol-ester/DAG-type domain-containing protein n=1 Tax=Leptidea sinapis TaxID=189913 RepID=A0A5E4QN33_9NEOP|nr:unnamed protein product [Leptidea sinapis]
MAKCNNCGRFFAEGSDGAKCKKCSVLFHKTCYPDVRNNNKWSCKDCNMSNKTKEACRELCSEVNETIDSLKKQLNDSEQDKLLNNVEISGLQENNGENLLHVVITLAQKIGFSLEERDIVNAYRLGARINAVESRGAVSKATRRPRAIVVRLTRRYLRDKFLHVARVRRGVDTTGMGLGGEPRRFYVNEHLTRVTRKLFYLAREELARQRNWRFVWCDQKSSVHVIRSEQDISKVFG